MRNIYNRGNSDAARALAECLRRHFGLPEVKYTYNGDKLGKDDLLIIKDSNASDKLSIVVLNGIEQDVPDVRVPHGAHDVACVIAMNEEFSFDRDQPELLRILQRLDNARPMPMVPPPYTEDRLSA